MIQKIRLQPLVSLKNNIVLGYEALYKKKLLSKFPSATTLVKALFQNHDFESNLCINMTPRDAINPNFAKNFLLTLNKKRIPGNHIILELSESTNPEFMDITKENLNMLHDCGIKIALDDFGVEYSTLNFLQEFPIDIVKIDQKFVQKAPKCKRALSILKSVVKMSHDLGCSVVAEGIETNESLNCALEAGADIGQGFIFSALEQKASPFVSFKEILAGLVKKPLKACYCA